MRNSNFKRFSKHTIFRIDNQVVTSKRRARHDHQRTTLTRQTISLFFDTKRPDFADTQAIASKKIKTPPPHKKIKF